MARENTGAAVRTARVGGAELDYAVFGTGEKAFVMLPGLSLKSVMGAADAVAAAYARFAEDYTVYLFDRRKNAPEAYSVRDMAADTAAVMRSLGLKNCAVFGASMGGMLAQYLAIDHPELVGRLALASTLPGPNPAAAAVLKRWLELAGRGDVETLVRESVEQSYSGRTLELYRDALIESSRGATADDLRRFVRMARACESFDTRGELDKIRCPALVLGAEGDRIATAAPAAELAGRLGCELCLYGEEYGHAVYDEAPDFKDRLWEFFQS